MNQVVFVSETPGPYEIEHSSQVVEQLIRPTGLVEPLIDVRSTEGQIDDLYAEVTARAERGERSLVTTLTKKMAEDLTDYLQEMGVRAMYLHSEIDTLERVEILRDLRAGTYDVVVGINLLREGLDLPEVSLVCVLDADKEGFLRSTGSLIQTVGRAARHPRGQAILYADVTTDSMRRALDETQRRRVLQQSYNEEHHITPQGIEKTIRDITDRLRGLSDQDSSYTAAADLPREELGRLIDELEQQMRDAARDLEFERAGLLRDQVMELRGELLGQAPAGLRRLAPERPSSGAGGRGRGRGRGRRRR